MEINVMVFFFRCGAMIKTRLKETQVAPEPVKMTTSAWNQTYDSVLVVEKKYEKKIGRVKPSIDIMNDKAK